MKPNHFASYLYSSSHPFVSIFVKETAIQVAVSITVSGLLMIIPQCKHWYSTLPLHYIMKGLMDYSFNYTQEKISYHIVTYISSEHKPTINEYMSHS